MRNAAWYLQSQVQIATREYISKHCLAIHHMETVNARRYRVSQETNALNYLRMNALANIAQPIRRGNARIFSIWYMRNAAWYAKSSSGPENECFGEAMQGGIGCLKKWMLLTTLRMNTLSNIAQPYITCQGGILLTHMERQCKEV